jgi:hypothetical protein
MAGFGTLWMKMFRTEQLQTRVVVDSIIKAIKNDHYGRYRSHHNFLESGY